MEVEIWIEELLEGVLIFFSNKVISLSTGAYFRHQQPLLCVGQIYVKIIPCSQ